MSLFVTPDLKSRIARLERQVQALRGSIGLSPVRVTPSGGEGSQLIISLDFDDWFPVIVTGYVEYAEVPENMPMPGSYEWREQTYDRWGNLIDKENGRSGDYNSNPLYEMNGRVLTSFPFYAFARRRILSRTDDDTDGFGIAFEFDMPAEVNTVELRGLTFTSNTGATSGDPGNGKLLWNNATQGSATGLNFDDLTSDSVNVTTLFAAIGRSGFLRLQQYGDATRWQEWEWTAVTDDTGFTIFVVTLLAKSANDIQNAQTVLCDFRPGDLRPFTVRNSADTISTIDELIVADTNSDILEDNLDGTNTLNEASAITGGTLTTGAQQVKGPKEFLDTATFSYATGASALAWTSNVVNVYNSGSTTGGGGIVCGNTITVPNGDWSCITTGLVPGSVLWSGSLATDEAGHTGAGIYENSTAAGILSTRMYDGAGAADLTWYLNCNANVVGTYRTLGAVIPSGSYIFSLGESVGAGNRSQWLRFLDPTVDATFQEFSEYSSRYNGSSQMSLYHWTNNTPEAWGELRITNAASGGGLIFGLSGVTCYLGQTSAAAMAATIGTGGSGYNLYDLSGYYYGRARTGIGPDSVFRGGILVDEGVEEFAAFPADLTTDVTGVLPAANGGTGQNTLALADAALASASGAIADGTYP